MYTLELNLKHTPLPLVVHKKTLEDAQADYAKVSAAMLSGSATALELTCEQVTDKRLTVLSTEVAAIQLYEKSGTASSSGKPPGFFSMLGE
jgi:hypothetical protein